MKVAVGKYIRTCNFSFIWCCFPKLINLYINCLTMCRPSSCCQKSSDLSGYGYQTSRGVLWCLCVGHDSFWIPLCYKLGPVDWACFIISHWCLIRFESGELHGYSGTLRSSLSSCFCKVFFSSLAEDAVCVSVVLQSFIVNHFVVFLNQKSAKTLYLVG